MSDESPPEVPPGPPPLDLTKRTEAIGASEIAGVLGLSRYEDPFTVYSRKVGTMIEPPGGVLNIKRRMGKAMESEILALYTEATKRKIIRPETIVHPDRPWQIATPDALVVDENRGVECKTAGYRQAHLWGDPENPAEADRVPTEYFLQCQWSLSVCRADVWDLAAWIGSEFFGIYTITPDKELEEMMLEGAREFVENHLKPRIPPPIGWTASSSEWIKSKYPTSTKDLTIPATSEHLEMATRLFTLEKIISAFEESLDGTKNKIKAMMGSAEAIEGTGWKIRWKKNKNSRRIDWEAAAIEMQTALQMVASEFPPTIATEAAKAALGAIERHTREVEGNRPFGKHWLPEPVFIPRLKHSEPFQNLARLLETAVAPGSLAGPHMTGFPWPELDEVLEEKK